MILRWRTFWHDENFICINNVLSCIKASPNQESPAICFKGPEIIQMNKW